MSPEIRADVPQEHFKEVIDILNSIPGVRIIQEKSYEQFFQNLDQVLGNLDSDTVRVADLYTSRSRGARRTLKEFGLTRQTPQTWQEFYDRLNIQEKSILGFVFKPLIEFGYGHFTLNELQNIRISSEEFKGVESAMRLVQKLGVILVSNQS